MNLEATCPRCGNTFEVKRELGTGRKHPRKKYNENHKAIHDTLQMLPHPISVSNLRVILNTNGPALRTKRSTSRAWQDEDSQSYLSDLVGWGFVSMHRTQGKETWVYSFKAPKIILEKPAGEEIMNQVRNELQRLPVGTDKPIIDTFFAGDKK